MTGEQPDDLMLPCPPQPGYFDAARGAWIFSRYADVIAALHEPCLEPDGHGTQSAVRVRTQATLSAARLRQWQSQIEPLACDILSALASDTPVDLVREFAEPWCLAVAGIVTGAGVHDKRLAELARRISAAAADPRDPIASSAAAAAGGELERSIPPDSLPMAAAAFVALAQTLPAFLANAWLALLRHPGELVRLQEDPDLLPGAIEELLRYAGLARSLSRVATGATILGEVKIATGQRVALLLHSANRDPAPFPDPNRLDITRRAAGHLAFGAGPHSCVAAALIRMAALTATSAFIGRFHHAEVREPLEWRGGTGFRAPAALYVTPYRDR